MMKKDQIDHETSLSDEEKYEDMKDLVENIIVHIRYLFLKLFCLQ